MNVRELFNGSPKYLRAQDFVEMDLKTPPYLIAPFFPTGGTCVLFGRGGSGKTQLALTMAGAILDGGFFLSKFKARRGRVVLVEVDTPPLVMQERLRKMSSRLDLGSLGLAMYDSAVDVVEEAQRLKGTKTPPEWVKAVRSQKPDLVIIDTLRQTHAMDENDSRAPSMVKSAWRQLLGSGPALLFIHHARKVPMEFRMEDDVQGARGSGAWLDDVDCQMQMIDKGGGNRVVKWTKHRTCPEYAVPAMTTIINPETLVVELADRPTVRALELLEVGLGKKEVAQHLVKEGICTKTVAYDRVKKLQEEILDKG